MIEAFKFHHLLLLVAILLASETTLSYGESSTCLTVYKEGGAPAVFQSPKCPRWTLPNYGSTTTAPCQMAILQGRRKSQEDRTLCALDIRIPFLSRFLLLIALIPFYLAYIAETPLSTSILFPFRPIFVSCSEFSMAKDCFWEFN